MRGDVDVDARASSFVAEKLGDFRGHLGMIQGYIGIMEKRMETTTMGLYRV